MKRLIEKNSSGKGVQVGLERVSKVAMAGGLFGGGKTPIVSNVAESTTFVHVAGTNGKGSVCNKVYNALVNKFQMTKTPKEGRLSIGMFTSPHLGTYRERIQVDGEMISEKCANELTRKIENISVKVNVDPTYFEMLTLLAFFYFEKCKVDIAIVEAGLGGLGDSTNVIPNPKVCVITSVGLDHQEFLGNTKAEIAQQKAGIFKPNSTVILGPNAKPYSIFENQARISQVGKIIQVPPPTSGNDVNAENSLVAQNIMTALGYSDIELDELEKIRMPGRFECFDEIENKTVILDAAHNQDAFERLGNELSKKYENENVEFHFLIAMAKNKDLESNLKALLSNPKCKSCLGSISFAKSENMFRTAEIQDMVSAAKAIDSDLPIHIPSASTPENDGILHLFEETLSRHQGEENDGNNQVIVVCGSFNALAKIRSEYFDQSMSIDPINMNENKLK